MRRTSTINKEAVRSSIVIVAPTRSSMKCGEIILSEGLKPKRLIRKHNIRRRSNTEEDSMPLYELDRDVKRVPSAGYSAGYQDM
jgi:hypothetical protein